VSAEIPWHATLRARLIWWLWKPAWAGYWVRYWESQGIPEDTQMEWAAKETARERLEDADVS
jgi:hypothetical protein